MAKVMVIGKVAQVELLADPNDEELVLAKCRLHRARGYGSGPKCIWQDRFDTTDDAIAGAEQHADGVR